VGGATAVVAESFFCSCEASAILCWMRRVRGRKFRRTEGSLGENAPPAIATPASATLHRDRQGNA
jgi:hypothetical protein